MCVVCSTVPFFHTEAVPRIEPVTLSSPRFVKEKAMSVGYTRWVAVELWSTIPDDLRDKGGSTQS